VEVLGERAFRTIRPYIDRVLAGEHVEYETEIAYATAGPRYMHVQYVPDYDSEGAVRGWIATVNDITARRRVEEKLRQTERHADEFLVMLAHQLRNPFAPIMGGVEKLRRASGPQATQSTLSSMERQIAHLRGLVKDLLDLTTPSSRHGR